MQPLGTLVTLVLATGLACVPGSSVLGMLTILEQPTIQRTIEGYVAVTRATITISLDDPLITGIVRGAVIRLYYDDGGTAGWQEVRIQDLRAGAREGTVVITANGVEDDLARGSSFVFDTVGGALVAPVTDYAITPAAAMAARVIPNAPSYFALGTVTPTTALRDITYGATPLEAAVAIAARVADLTGVAYEIWVERIGTTRYDIHLAVLNGSAPVADIRDGKNLISFQRSEDGQQADNRIGFTSPAALQRPTYAVSLVNAAHIHVVDIGGGRGPAREIDQWNTAYCREWKNNTPHQITDTVVIDPFTTRLLMASTSGITVGDLVYLTRNSGGDDLSHVDAPSLQALYGVQLGQLPGGDGLTNQFANADLRAGSSSTPDGFTITGAPVRITTAGLWREGGAAYRVSTTNAAITQLVTRYAAAGEIWTYSLGLYIEAFDGRINLRNPNASDTYFMIDGTVADLSERNQHIVFSRSFQIASSGAKSFGVTVGKEGVGAGSIIVDWIQLVRGPAVPFRFGSAAAEAVAAANHRFDSHGHPLATYELEVADLRRLSPSIYPDDQVRLGAYIDVTETRLREVRRRLRIVQHTETGQLATPRLVVNTRRDRLTSILTR